MQEFVDPTVLNQRQFLIKAEHLMRYWFARDFLNKVVPRSNLGTKSNTVVFDFACGNGYGSNMLSETASLVIGADRNKALIDEASRKLALNKKLEFYNMNLETTDFSEWTEENQIPQPDVIVSYETLEHLDMPETFLTAMSELLSSGGYFICSVPNARYDANKDGLPKDKYHKQLFIKDEFIKMLCASGFMICDVYGQPITNFIAEHSRKISTYLNSIALNSEQRFELLAKIFAYPIKYLQDYSYSHIFIAKKE